MDCDDIIAHVAVDSCFVHVTVTLHMWKERYFMDRGINIEQIFRYFERPNGKVTLGIDGFVDDVWQIISVRNGPDDYVLYESMKDFAKSVYDVGAGGYANEIIRKRRSHGGFTAHTGEAVDNLGLDLMLVGMFDQEGGGGIDPVYQVFSDRCKVYSVGCTAVCPIYEFLNGKMMFPYVAKIAEIDIGHLTSALSSDELTSIYGGRDVVGLGYWSLLDNFDNLITKLCEDYIGPGTRLFFDFADIRKRTKDALFCTLRLLAKLSVPATLSLNEHEGTILFSHFGKDFNWRNPEGADREIEHVRQQTGLDEVIVHTPYFAVGASSVEGVAVVNQRFCENPVVTTGAGDNFNGGYVSAIAQKDGLNLSQRLLVGNAVSSFYVQTGVSPNKEELVNEIKQFRALL